MATRLRLNGTACLSSDQEINRLVRVATDTIQGRAVDVADTDLAAQSAN